MALEFVDLRPYKSLLLARLRDDLATEGAVDAVLADATDLLASLDAGVTVLDRVAAATTEVPVAGTADVIETGFLHYRERRAPGWFGGDTGVEDVLNHLLVVSRLGAHMAIYLSDGNRRRAISRRISGAQGDGFGRLELIEQGRCPTTAGSGRASPATT